MNEQIVLVDINYKAIGYDTKKRGTQKGRLHRAFSKFIYRKNEILMQKRSNLKYYLPRVWPHTCCSHQRIDEELTKSVSRRLYEEIGIKCKTIELELFICFDKFSENMYEYDHIFIGEYLDDRINDN